MSFITTSFTRNMLAALLLMLLSSCSSNLTDYQTNDTKQTTFDIKNYFNGKVHAWGMIQDRSKKVTRRFCVDIIGTWQVTNDQLARGELAETFYFDDGEITTRNWQLRQQADGRYLGTAEDVEGTASGSHQGFAFHWQYYLQVPIGDANYQFWLDDWMFQLDQRRVFNRTSMEKFGVTLAEITIFFDNQPQEESCQISTN